MTASLVGQVSIGQCVPTTASLVAASLTNLQAQLTGALAAQAHIALAPPTLATSLQAALALVESLQFSIALGLPNVSVDLTAMVAVIAQLSASVAALLAVNVTLGTAGVYVFTHHGLAPTFGGEMQAKISAVAPPQNAVHSVTFLATDPAVFEALGKVLLTS